MIVNIVLNDEKLKQRLDNIDKNSSNRISHGYQHALNVVENIKKLSQLLEIDHIEEDELIIAGYLHDIGQESGEANHFIRSEAFAKEYLKDKLSLERIEKIAEAIRYHHECEKINELSLYQHILLIADKLDFSRQRINPNRRTSNEEGYESNVLKVNFWIENKYFIVEITIKDKTCDIKKWEYYKKIQTRTEEFAKKLNLEGKIIIHLSE